jgi:hypothetical protein
MMKNKLNSVLSADKVRHEEYSDNEIYVADYTERTKSAKEVEVCNTKPDDIDVLTLKNEALISITASIFGKQCFMNEQNKEIKHCECIMYPTKSSFNTWVLFVEIKDCKPKNVSKWFVSAKEQIKQTVQLFRERNLIETNRKVHAVISFPRNKMDFYSNLIQNEERQQFLHQYGIIIRGANKVVIKSDRNIV